MILIPALPPSQSDSSSPFCQHSSVAGWRCWWSDSESVSLGIQDCQLIQPAGIRSDVGPYSSHMLMLVSMLGGVRSVPRQSSQLALNNVWFRSQLVTIRSAVIYCNDIIGSTTSLSQHPSHSEPSTRSGSEPSLWLNCLVIKQVWRKTSNKTSLIEHDNI